MLQNAGMVTETVAQRLADAAFELFGEHGYDETTVDEIAERAGVGRTTFFRYYPSKEDVIFPDHETLLAAVSARLATSSQSTALVAVTDAVRLVLEQYVSEGKRARQRYALTKAVPALRDREIAGAAQYQRLFRGFIAAWMGDAPSSALRSELMAAAVVAAHNHVLRRWLRGESAEPLVEVDVAMNQVNALFGSQQQAPSARKGRGEPALSRSDPTWTWTNSSPASGRCSKAPDEPDPLERIAVLRVDIIELSAINSRRVDTTPEQLTSLESEYPGQVITRIADVRDAESVVDAAAVAMENFGRLDAAVAAAAVIIGGQPLWETARNAPKNAPGRRRRRRRRLEHRISLHSADARRACAPRMPFRGCRLGSWDAWSLSTLWIRRR